MKKLLLFLVLVSSFCLGQNKGNFVSVAKKQIYWDSIAALPSVDYGQGPRTTDGHGGFWKETTFSNQCANGDECMGIMSFGANKPSPANLLYGGNLSLTPTNALCWWKDAGNTTSLAPLYIDRGNFDKYLRFWNGPPNTSYYETNPGAFTAKTHPVDIIIGLRWMVQTNDEGSSGIKVLTNNSEKLSFIDSYTPDITLASGNAYNHFTESVMRVHVASDQSWEVWINGVSVGTGTGVSFSTTEWWWGTNSHVLGMHMRYSLFHWGTFTDTDVNKIYQWSRAIWPWGKKPDFPLMTELYYGDATTFNSTTKTWTPGLSKSPVYSGGTGTQGTFLYEWFYFQASDATRFPAADGILTNHRQIPPSVNISTMGSGNSVTSVTMDGGSNLLSSSVTWTTDLATTGAAIVTNINANQTAYVAELRTETILLHPNGLGCNAYHVNDVTIVGSGFSPTSIDAPRGSSLVRTTYAAGHQIFAGHQGDNTISIGCVIYPVDNNGQIGEPLPTRWIADNIP